MFAKISAQDNKSSSRFVIKFNKEDTDALNWEKHDYIRVITKKKENKILLKKVKNKYSKQVTYTLTSTGRGSFNYDLGLFVKHKETRFSSKPKNGSSHEVCVSKVGKCVEISMPKDVLV